MGILSRGENMCDIDKKTRSERYNKIRSLGYTRGWAQRARDFTEIRFQQALNGGKRTAKKKPFKKSCYNCNENTTMCCCPKHIKELKYEMSRTS